RALRSQSEADPSTTLNQTLSQQKAPMSAGDVSNPESQIANLRLLLCVPMWLAGNLHIPDRPSRCGANPHRPAKMSQPKLQLQQVNAISQRTTPRSDPVRND